MKNKYIKRIADKEIKFRLGAIGAIHIVGPKFCGKTTTSSIFANTVIHLKDPDYRSDYLETAKLKPSNLLQGKKPVLLDEWQIAPNLWDAVRISCDDLNRSGLYILTGSNTIDFDETFHTGTGRISTYMMYPMSLFESGESTGEISLKNIFNNKFKENAIPKVELNEVIFAACRGGWPASILKKTKKEQLFVAKDLIKTICNSDIREVDEHDRDPEKTKLIIQSYARNISTLAKDTTIYEDVRSRIMISDKLFYDYVKALKKMFIISNVPAWSPSIRSKRDIRSTEKKMLIDPSLAVAALNLSPEVLERDLKTFGFIFEALVIRDLRVYIEAIGGYLSYYRDRNGLEVDVVIHLDDGRYGLAEIKLGAMEYIDEAAKHLKKLSSQIKEHNKNVKIKMDEPSFLMVITATTRSFKRPDGVLIVPITCLKD